MQLAQRKPSEANPARMRPLAKLPIFLDLAGKRAVVAGGTAAAAWKAELLAAAGANVVVYAETLSTEMTGLLERGAAAGTITHLNQVWTREALAGSAVVLADAECDGHADAVLLAAREAGVLCNVIDKPRYCQFQFGSIVNRSPVVIGISTDGAAPILGQAIRRRIETLLPPALSTWARLAKDVRDLVGRTLTSGLRRRAFWEQFADRALSSMPAASEQSDLVALIRDIAADDRTKRGKVTLVGAGPGDAELLTLKAVRALQSADVILYDDLVSDEVLELARREAKRMMVGKRGQRESCAQDDINALMVTLAKRGRHVVRLKSGDPSIFGRAGEEIAELEKHGIPFSIVPGITSASAMAATLGLSLTHRAHAQSVRFVTGHARSGQLPDDLDWRGLADPRTTLVVYMGGRTAARFASELIAHGLDQATPVVAMASASRHEAKAWRSTLKVLADDGLPPHMGTPVLIGIGTALAATSRWMPCENPIVSSPELRTASQAGAPDCF